MGQLTTARLLKLLTTLLLTGTLLCFVTPSKGETMLKTSDIVNILQRQGDKLFQGNSEYYSKLSWDKLDDLPFLGVAVLAPTQIHTNKQHKLPVIIYTQTNPLRNWEVTESENLMFAIRDINTGKLWMERVFTSNKRERVITPEQKEEHRGSKPSIETNEDYSYLLENIDALKKYDIPWSTSTLSVTAISYDWKSNTTQVELIGEQPQVLMPLPVSPLPAESKGQALPSYMANSKSPKPQPNTLSFSIDMASTTENHIVIHGSFSKVLRKNEIHQTPETIRDHGVDQQVVGIVPITFAFLKLDWAAPMQKTINVPVYKSNISGDKAQGYFHVNIPTDFGLNKNPYIVYAFMEGKVIGPVKLDLSGKTKDKVAAKESFFDSLLAVVKGKS